MRIKYKSESYEVEYNDDADRGHTAAREESEKRANHLMKLIDADVQSTLKNAALSRMIKGKEFPPTSQE